MITDKNAQASVRLTVRHHAPIEIVHDLRNCMSIVLLNVGNLEAHRMAQDKRALETLEKMIQKMNGLLEELAESFGEKGPAKKTILKGRAYRPQKLPAA